LKSAANQFLEAGGHTATIPSNADVIAAILGKCSKKTEVTTCVDTDLDESRVECWIPKNIDEGDCIKALVESLEQPVGEDDKSTLPHEWIRPLFNVEMVDIKSVKRKKTKSLM
jgi:ribosomal protein S2